MKRKETYRVIGIIALLLGIALLHLIYEKKPIKVAVLDSGINKDHPALKGKIHQSFNAIEPNKPIEDHYGHGTAIAGIIAAEDTGGKMSGLAQNVSIYDVKVLDKKGNGKVADLVKGINWCIEEKVDIINISSGFQVDDPSLRKAIDEALSSGIIIIAAAGNTLGQEADYPARYEGVWSITSVNSNLVRSTLAARGKVDFTTTGTEVLSINKEGDFETFSGTSFAAAQISGYTARILDSEHSRHRDIKNIYRMLQTEAIDLGEAGPDQDYGHGLVRIK
ncbi:MAG: S8 family peptidase [Bacillota bacterium]|uniref:S8 family peptidase n=1 Tax=Rossellomorea sp. FM04394 TaxID=3243076 RepID=UPI0035A57289